MIRVCAWCGVVLGGGESGTDTLVTHGMCADCRAGFRHSEDRDALLQLLDRLDAPVVLVDGNVRALGANLQAAEILGTSVRSVEGLLGGDLIECARARLPGGCGRTEHCAACTIRQTVTDTHRTGQSHVRIVARPVIATPKGDRVRRVVISTERAGGCVLLRIDEGPAPDA